MSAPDHDEQRRIRRGRRRFLLLVTGMGVLVAVVGVAVFACLGGYHSDAWDGEPPPWAEVVGLVLAGLGLVVVVAVFIYALRAGGFRADRHSPLWAVSWSRRRQLAWTIRRGGEVPEEDLPLSRHTAELLAGQRWLIGLFVGLAIIYAGQSLLQWAPIWLALLPVLVSLYAVAAVLALRNARRGEAFLRAHPAPGEDPQDATTSLI